MNFTNLIKPLLQSALDTAMPAIKVKLKSAILLQLMQRGKIDADTATLLVGSVNAAIDDWTIKL